MPARGAAGAHGGNVQSADGIFTQTGRKKKENRTIIKRARDGRPGRVIPSPADNVFENEEDCAMLPCQDSCPDYQTGCHKQCQRWREYQQHQQLERARKTTYLRFYRDLCGTIARQLRADTARYPMR